MTDRSSSTSALLLAALVLLAGCDRFTSVETRMARARASLHEGKYRAAVIDLREVLDSKPGNLDAQLLLADALAESGQTEAARQQLERAIKAGAPVSATEGRYIRLLLSLGDREALRKALASSTTLSAGERATLEGRLQLLDRNPVAAQAAFERALAADPDSNAASLGRIEAIAAQGQTNEARRLVDALVTRKPDSGGAWVIKGSLAAQSGDFAAAAQALSTALEHSREMSHADIVQAHAQRVESYLAAGQRDSARSALAALNAVARDSAVASFMGAKVALADRDAATAVNLLRKFTQVAPEYMPGRLLLAAALLEQGSTEQAFAEAARNVSEFADKDEPKLALADIELRLGRTADAEQTLQSLIERSPPNPLAMATLGELRIRRGEAVAGVSLLEQSLAEQPRNSRLRLQLAAAYLSTGEPKRALPVLDAIDDGVLSAARDRLRVIATAGMKGSATGEKELEDAVKRHPRDVDLLLMAAAFQASADHIDQARAYVQKAREVRPDDVILALALGRLELSAGRTDEAASIASTVLAKAPNNTGAMTLMAGIAAQRGQTAEVDAWLNRARIASPEAIDVRLALARRAAARGDIAEARNVLTEAARNAPHDPTARIALAQLDTASGRSAEALNGLREAARQEPNSPSILLAMARIQLASKDSDAARNTLKQALETAPGWPPAAATLAALETAAGHLDAALEVVHDLRRRDPDGAASFALEGDVYTAAKRPADAAAAFVTAYKRNPGGALATRAARAKSAARMRAPEAELVDWLTRAPNDTNARRTLAEYQMATGRNAAAIEELEKVVKARPTDVVALNNLALLYQQSNDARARSTAEKAYAAAPKVAAVADTYGWILVRSRDVEKGLQVLEQAAERAPEDGQIQFHLASALSEGGQRERAVTILRRIVDAQKPFESRDEAAKLLRTLGH